MLRVLAFCVSGIICLLIGLVPMSQLRSYMEVHHYLLAKKENVSIDTKMMNNLIIMKRLNEERGWIGDILINDNVSHIAITTNTTGTKNN